MINPADYDEWVAAVAHAKDMAAEYGADSPQYKAAKESEKVAYKAMMERDDG